MPAPIKGRNPGSPRAASQNGMAMARTRIAIVSVSLLVMFSLLAAWLVVRSSIQKPVDKHISILEIPIQGSENNATVTAADLLAAADKQAQVILDAYPDLAAAYNLKANRDYLTGNMDVAKENWQKALSLDPRSSEAMFGLALISFEASEFERAIELGEQCMVLNAGNPRVPLLLGDSYLQNGQPEKAILSLSQHLASEPSSVQAIELLGTAFLNARDYENAIEQFKRATQFSPNSKDSQYGLAQAYSKLGKKEEAKIHLDKFNELSKDIGAEHRKEAQAFRDREFAAHVAAQVNADAAMIYKEHREYQKAADCLLRSQRLQPDVITWLEELQRCYFALGQARNAADVGDRLTKLDPKNVDYWLTLGQVYSSLENADATLASFQKAIELAPNDERCLRAQAVLEKLNAK